MTRDELAELLRKASALTEDGEMSPHQEEHGVYAEGVHMDTVVLPEGWRKRTIAWHRDPSSPRFLERHDLCASKLARGAQKDLDLVGALVDAGLIDIDTLLERTRALRDGKQKVAAAVARANSFRQPEVEPRTARQIDQLAP